MQPEKGLKARLKEGSPVLGTWCSIPSASMVNVIAATGLDFVVIDMEHGPHTFPVAEDMIRAAETEGCSPIVRVAVNDEALVLNALDIGAHGVIVPHIESRQDAELAITYAKYHPLGKRGFSPFTRAGGYSPENVSQHARTQNERTLVTLLVEGDKGVANLAEILAIEDIQEKVDVIYVGVYDLSQALGRPGEVDHPEVRGKFEGCVEAIRARGIAPGGYVAKNRQDLGWLCQMGVQFITLLPDCTVLFRAFEALRRDFDAARSETGMAGVSAR